MVEEGGGLVLGWGRVTGLVSDGRGTCAAGRALSVAGGGGGVEWCATIASGETTESRGGAQVRVGKEEEDAAGEKEEEDVAEGEEKKRARREDEGADDGSPISRSHI